VIAMAMRVRGDAARVDIRKKKHLIPTYSLLTPKIKGIRCSKME